jgi:hypothetical protein
VLPRQHTRATTASPRGCLDIASTWQILESMRYCARHFRNRCTKTGGHARPATPAHTQQADKGRHGQAGPAAAAVAAMTGNDNIIAVRTAQRDVRGAAANDCGQPERQCRAGCNTATRTALRCTALQAHCYHALKMTHAPSSLSYGMSMSTSIPAVSVRRC